MTGHEVRVEDVDGKETAAKVELPDLATRGPRVGRDVFYAATGGPMVAVSVDYRDRVALCVPAGRPDEKPRAVAFDALRWTP